ncbi:hypothetical protein PENTCL1PPCAC_30812, partial [Pristionchus entomophagus]
DDVGGNEQSRDEVEGLPLQGKTDSHLCDHILLVREKSHVDFQIRERPLIVLLVVLQQGARMLHGSQSQLLRTVAPRGDLEGALLSVEGKVRYMDTAHERDDLWIGEGNTAISSNVDSGSHGAEHVHPIQHVECDDIRHPDGIRRQPRLVETIEDRLVPTESRVMPHLTDMEQDLDGLCLLLKGDDVDELTLVLHDHLVIWRCR